MKVEEMKHLIKRYEEALDIIERHTNEFFTASVAKAALGRDSEFPAVQPFDKEV